MRGLLPGKQRSMQNGIATDASKHQKSAFDGLFGHIYCFIIYSMCDSGGVFGCPVCPAFVVLPGPSKFNVKTTW
jgi:hypothetical protein